MKVLLILVDGMRPDALVNIRQVEELKKKAAWTLDAQTVFPSATLPCHMSLFYSVEPNRHGTTTNTFAPQVRPIDGLFDVLHDNKKMNAMFYSWGQLRDVLRPGKLFYSQFCRPARLSHWQTNKLLCDGALNFIAEAQPDFTFLYLFSPDSLGHREGWMSEGYMKDVQECWDHIEYVLENLPEDYTVFITADHGGHERNHGTDLPEDMTIPLFALGPNFTPGRKLENASIMDIAPTVTALLGVETPEEWEGKCLL